MLGAKKVRYFLSITLLNGKVCEREITIRLFELRNSFKTSGYEKVCSCAPAFNLYMCH